MIEAYRHSLPLCQGSHIPELRSGVLYKRRQQPCGYAYEKSWFCQVSEIQRRTRAGILGVVMVILFPFKALPPLLTRVPAAQHGGVLNLEVRLIGHACAFRPHICRRCR